MEGVAELVKDGAHLVAGEQRGTSRGRRHEVADVDHHRQGIEEVGLIDEAGHPRSPALAGAREVVAHEQTDRCAVGPVHLPRAGVGGMQGEIAAFGEGDAVHAGRSREDAEGDHGVECEVVAEGGARLALARPGRAARRVGRRTASPRLRRGARRSPPVRRARRGRCVPPARPGRAACAVPLRRSRRSGRRSDTPRDAGSRTGQRVLPGGRRSGRSVRGCHCHRRACSPTMLRTPGAAPHGS
ncbi:hypothetical protein TPAU25S_00881 [Tsukamurella paurometabola]